MKILLASCLITPLGLFAGAGCSSSNTGQTGTFDAATASDLSTTNDLGSGNDLGGAADLANVAPPTEVMVARVGDGTATLAANTGAAVFLERHRIADGTLIGTPVAMPAAVNGANRPFTLSGNGVSEGALTRSVDGRYVLLAGYDATPGTTPLLDNSKRVVGRVAVDGSVDTTTSFDGISGAGNNVRGAASTNGTALWVSGVLGVAYTTLGNTAVPIRPLGDPFNMRTLGIIGGQLYASRSSVTAGGINTVGNGLPMTADVGATRLPGFPNNSNTLSPFGFVAFDRDAVPGIDTLYVADDRAAPDGGVQRWRLMNNSWTLEGTLLTGTGFGARGVTGFVAGTKVMLIATTAESTGVQTRLISFSDDGSAPATLLPTTLATAAAKTAYRGVCLAPTP